MPTVLMLASLSTSAATVGPSTGTHAEVSAAACLRAPESTMTFTPSQGPEAVLDDVALDDVAAEEAGADVDGWLAAGVEQAARENRRPAAASELAAAVRILVKVTCQG